MTRRKLSLLLAAVLVATLMGSAASPAAAATAAEGCENTVTHDAFLEDREAVAALANGSDVRSTESNTRVTVGESNTFYRIKGENPNTYCVHFTVLVHSDAIPPAQLPADIPSDNGEYEASWDAVHDFDTGDTYTEIQFTLPPETEAQWSPNEIRIASISWASETKSDAQGFFEQVSDRLGGSNDVSQRTYTLEANATGEQVTIPLENPRTGESIDDWHARYTTNDGETWHTLDQDADDPVFYSEAEDRSALRMTFNDKDARVKFVANPTRRDTAQHEISTYTSGVKELLGKLPFGSVAVPIQEVTLI